VTNATTRLGANVILVDDPSTYGEGIADVERPAEGFRGR
jgi:hypothetical protein